MKKISDPPNLSGPKVYYTTSDRPLPEYQRLCHLTREFLLALTAHCKSIITVNEKGSQVSSLLEGLTQRHDTSNLSGVSTVEDCAHFATNCHIAETIECGAQFSYMINSIQFFSLASLYVQFLSYQVMVSLIFPERYKNRKRGILSLLLFRRSIMFPSATSEIFFAMDKSLLH